VTVVFLASVRYCYVVRIVPFLVLDSNCTMPYSVATMQTNSFFLKCTFVLTVST